MSKKRARVLFERGNSTGAVVLNFTHSAIGEFVVYGEAYHDSALLLAKSLAEKPCLSDPDCLAVVFLYRHASELYLKGSILYSTWLLALRRGESSLPIDIFRLHQLTQPLEEAVRLLKSIGWDIGKDDKYASELDFTRRALGEFDEIDGGSYAFRYPVDTKRQASLPHHFAFDALRFARNMERILALLKTMAVGAESQFDHEQTMMGEMYSSM